MISRPEALELLGRYLKDEKMVKHCLAVGAVMKAPGRRLGEDENLWKLAGLLHDIDYEYVLSILSFRFFYVSTSV